MGEVFANDFSLFYRGTYVSPKEAAGENTSTENSNQSHKVNYNYHPIIDFFKSTPAAPVERVDIVDDWQPMTEGPRAI